MKPTTLTATAPQPVWRWLGLPPLAVLGASAPARGVAPNEALAKLNGARMRSLRGRSPGAVPPRFTRARAAMLSAVCAAVAWPVAGCALEPRPEPQQVEPRPTAADKGAALFDSPALSTAPFNDFACSTCHAAAGSPSDEAILPGAPLAGVVERPSYWGGAEVDLLRAVNHCLMYFMFQDEPWTGQEPEAVALYAYLESLSKDAAASVEPAPFTIVKVPADLPLGDAARGASVYGRACRECHGEPGSGDARLVEHAPVLPDDVLASHPSPDYTGEERRLVFVSKIRHGAFMGHAGQMPAFSAEALSDADVSDLLALFFSP